MNKKIATLIAGILLVGIVSAGLLTHFAVITGEVIVEGPVFYLDGSSIPLSDNPEVIYRGITINTPPTEENITYLFDGQRYLFMTEPLDVENFYQAKFDIKIWAKTNNSGNILQFQVVRIKPNLVEEIICVPLSVELTNIVNYAKKETSCSSSSEIILNPEDRIGLIISGAGVDSEYWISTGHSYTDGYSRVEVSAI
ncbi:MAG: hypothetical protein KJ721_02305 [Nanoarchaeota archaeon]|nr:hypothetical protein [Nanoarchaeota archaeon]